MLISKKANLFVSLLVLYGILTGYGEKLATYLVATPVCIESDQHRVHLYYSNILPRQTLW